MTDTSIKARTGLMGMLFGSGRTPTWDKAKNDYHAAHQTCEMCGLPAGSLGGNLDGATGVQCQLEMHDVQPYHTLTPDQQNDYNFIYNNLIALHHFEHHHTAHNGDPNCLEYNPQIREIAAYVLDARKYVTK